MRLRERYLRRFPAASATPPPSLSQSRRGRSTDAQRRYQELRSLLRRNQQMWAVESEWVSRHQTDPRGETITDLLLYEFFGHRSKRSRRREAQLRRWVARLNQIQYQLEAASAALDAGLLRQAERILRRTSHSLNILLDEDVARMRSGASGGGSPEATPASSVGARSGSV